MNLTRFVKSALSTTAVLAATVTAWGGCNCNIPPAPGMYPGNPGAWNTPMMGGGMPIGGPQYGAAGAYAAPVAYPGAMSGYGGMAGNVAPMTGAYGATGGYPGYTGTGFGYSPLPYGGMIATNGPHWAPGGYEPRIGSPAYYYDPAGGQYVVTGNPYYDHFGPGFHRYAIHGHYSFPYYSYRTPWYFPGRAVYNRNTNFAW